MTKTIPLLRDAGGDGLFVRTDVSKEAEVKSLVEQDALTPWILYECANYLIEK